jgi:hypothetical protein
LTHPTLIHCCRLLAVLSLVWLFGTAITLPPLAAHSPASRDQIIQAIEGYASRHAEQNKLETKLVIDLFKDNSAGLTPREIGEIYESAYQKNALALRSSPLRIISQYGGWLAAVVFLIAFLFRDAIKHSVERLWDAVLNHVIHKFSRAAFAQRRVLRKHRADARAKHRTLSIPFRREPIDLRTVFVPLGVHASQRTVETIDAVKACEDHKRIIVLGAPGSGKSVLLKHLMLHYSDGGFDRVIPWALAILIELRRINEVDLANIDIREQLLEALKRGGVKSPEPLLDGGLARRSVMLLLDGLDEVNTDRRKLVAQKITDFLDKNDECRAVITCRTQVYDQEFDTVSEKRFEIEEFRDAQIRQFLESWQDQMPEGKSADQLIGSLVDRPRILALARNPLLLTIIAYLYVDTPMILPQSRAEFYERATFILLGEWKEERNRFKPSEKVAVLRHLAMMHQGRSAEVDQDRLAVPGEEVLTAIKEVIPQISSLPEDVTAYDVLAEIVERSGLILAVDGGQRYQFAHLTLQEFFAADACRHQFGRLLALFQDDPDRWRESVKLWCGLADDATAMVREVFETEPFTALEGLADARRVDEPIANYVIEGLKASIAEAADRTEAAQAFGAVASDTRGSRGRSSFAFLVETIRSDIPAKRNGATAALAATNLSAAAMTLADIYNPEDEFLRAALVRLGNLAVPRLSQLARNNSSTAIDDLHRIETPQAAAALAGLLAGVDENISRRAAWRVVTFFTRTEVAHALDQLTPDLRLSQAKVMWGWVWEPFMANATSPLVSVVARMAELISTTHFTDVTELANAVKTIDQRFVLALLANSADALHNLPLDQGLIAEMQFSLATAPLTHLTAPNAQTERRKARVELYARVLEKVEAHLHETNRMYLAYIARLCSQDYITLVFSMILSGNRLALVRQFLNQFTSKPWVQRLSFCGWFVAIVQLLFLVVVLCWYWAILFNIDGFEVFGYSIRVAPLVSVLAGFKFLCATIVTILTVGLASAIITILFANRAPRAPAVLYMMISIAIFGSVLNGIVAVALVALAFSMAREEDERLDRLGTFAAAFLLAILVFVYGIFVLLFFISWYNFADESDLFRVAPWGSGLLSMFILAHWGLIVEVRRSDNLFRGRFARSSV